VDLAPLVKDNGPYSIVLVTFDGTPLSPASRNASFPYCPQLVVDVLAGFNEMPVATKTFHTTDSIECNTVISERAV
jgi:hypothetical protein